MGIPARRELRILNEIRKWIITFDRVIEKRMKIVFSNDMKLLNLASHRLKIKIHNFTFTKPSTNVYFY